MDGNARTYTAFLWRDEDDTFEEVPGMRLVAGAPATTMRFRYNVDGEPWVETFILFGDIPNADGGYEYRSVYVGPITQDPE